MMIGRMAGAWNFLWLKRRVLGALAAALLWLAMSLSGSAPSADDAVWADDPEPGLAAGENSSRFRAEYAARANQLRKSISGLHGKARYRKQRVGDPGEWFSIEFFVEDGNLRLQRGSPAPADDAPAAEVKPPEALLITPDVAAKVVDPQTDFAWATFVADKPNAALKLEADMTFWRFLRCSYCVDTEPLADRLADGRYILESVDRDASHSNWLRIKCRFIDPADEEAWTARGTVEAWVDDAQGWVIRETRRVSGEPYMFEATSAAGPFVTLANGACVPKAYQLTTYDLAGSTGGVAPTPTEGRRWSERVEFELISAEPVEIPPSQFTLASLGIAGARQRLTTWLILAASALLVALAAEAFRRYRRRAHASF